MTNCIAPLMVGTTMLIASTIGPHAEQCPKFTGPENYVCEDRMHPSSDRLPLTIKGGDVSGTAAYQIGSRGGSSTLVVGKTSEKTVDGKTFVTTVSCGPFKGQKDPVTYNSLILREQVKDTAISSTTYFFPARKGIVRLTFGAAGLNGPTSSYNVCHPVNSTPKTAKPTAKPPGQP